MPVIGWDGRCPPRDDRHRWRNATSSSRMTRASSSPGAPSSSRLERVESWRSRRGEFFTGEAPQHGPQLLVRVQRESVVHGVQLPANHRRRSERALAVGVVQHHVEANVAAPRAGPPAAGRPVVHRAPAGVGGPAPIGSMQQQAVLPAAVAARRAGPSAARGPSRSPADTAIRGGLAAGQRSLREVPQRAFATNWLVNSCDSFAVDSTQTAARGLTPRPCRPSTSSGPSRSARRNRSASITVGTGADMSGRVQRAAAQRTRRPSVGDGGQPASGERVACAASSSTRTRWASGR